MRKVIAISGASGGIGAAEAHLFVAQGDCVYDLSRSGTSADGIIHINTDVTAEASVEAAFAQIMQAEGKLDILICNAGCGISGAAECTDFEDAKRQLDVNFFGMFLCCKHALPLLRKAHGRIVTTSSAAAVFAIPFQSFYSASKAAINAFTLALRNEVHPFCVSVCAIMPGDVSTGFTAARKKAVNQGVYGDVVERSVAVMEHDEKTGMRPEQVARYFKKIAEKKHVRPLYTAGFQYKIFMCINKCTSVSFVNYLVGKLYIKADKRKG